MLLTSGVMTPDYSTTSSLLPSTETTSGDSTSAVSSIKKPINVQQFVGEVTYLVISSFLGYGVHNGRLDGEGELFFQNGCRYVGTLVDGGMQGHGKYIWPNGDVYEGEFSWSKIQGMGKYNWNDGSWYSGQLVNGRKHGEGKFCQGDENFLLYIGRWESGLRHGWGREDYNAEGTWFYEGMWSRGSPHGYGTKKYKSGNIYSGMWKKGKAHGYGTMHWKQKGQLYKGMWQNGVQHGHGEQYWFAPSTISLRFLQPNMYKGDWVQGMREGHGIFIYADGCKYEGSWAKNVKQGMGKFFLKNGGHMDGHFERDNLLRDVTTRPDFHQTCQKVLTIPFNTNECVETKMLFFPVLEDGLPGILDAASWKKQNGEVKNVILRHTELLRDVYFKYGNLGKTEDKLLMRGCVMEGIQFLQLIRDMNLHQEGWTVQKAFMLIKSGSNRISWIHKKILPRKFIKKLLILAHHFYLKRGVSPQPISLVLNDLINYQILPNFGTFTGILYSKPEQTQYLLWYADNLTNVYRVVSNHLLPKPGMDMTARQLLLFMKELQMLQSPLTAQVFINCMMTIVPALKQNDSHLLELKLCFADFVDIILTSALHFPLPIADAKSLPIDSSPPTEQGTIASKSFARISPSCTKSNRSFINSAGKFKIQPFGNFDVHTSCSYLDDLDSPASQEFPITSNWTESTHILKKYFCSEDTGYTIDQEMELTVWKIQRFLDDEFFPAVDFWVAVQQEAEVLSSEQEVSSRPSSEVFIIYPIHPGLGIEYWECLSTFWFDES